MDDTPSIEELDETNLPAGTCPECMGLGFVGDVSVYMCRVLPPAVAQQFHELLQEVWPDHDRVECHCCCLDCPGWTQDMQESSEEEIRDIIPLHDLRSGKPLPPLGYMVPKIGYLDD